MSLAAASGPQGGGVRNIPKEENQVKEVETKHAGVSGNSESPVSVMEIGHSLHLTPILLPTHPGKTQDNGSNNNNNDS